LKISAKKGCFLSFEWEKANFTTFDPPRKILEKSPNSPPWKKSFRRPCLFCWRSVSKLKLIKKYLRSSMSTLQLRSLATLFVEQQLTDNINLDVAIEEFANKKARKLYV